MKIAVVFDKMIYGGIERVGIDHIKLMKELGHDVDVYVLSEKTEPIVDELKKLCEVKIVPFSRFYCPEIYWTVTRRLSIGKYIFPFIYLLVIMIDIFLKIFKKQRKRYDISIAFSGHFNDLCFVARNFVNANKKIAWLHSSLYQYIILSQGFEELYKVIKNLVVLVDHSQEEVLLCHKKNGFDFNIQKIYNPIDFSEKYVNIEKVSALKKKYGDFIVMVARLTFPKDHITVIQAIKILNEKYHRDLKLLLVGDGECYEQILQFCIKEKVLNKYVFLEGSKSNVQDYYSAAKLSVLSSISEGLGMVILESLYYGVPVVATDCPNGPREILGNDEYGLLTKVGNPEDMAEKINKLLCDKDLYEYYAVKGKERILDFSPDIIKGKLQILFNSLL